MHINLAVPEVDAYRIIQAPPVTYKYYDYNIDNSTITSIATVYSLILAGNVSEGTMYNIDANIMSVDLSADWKYIRCTICRKKASMLESNYFCSNCSQTVANPRPVYKLSIQVFENGNEMTCVLFNDATIPLLGMTAHELMTKSLLEGTNDPYWIEDFLNDFLCARRVIFRIAIKSFNLSPTFSGRFSVSKYLGDDITLLQERNFSGHFHANPPSASVLNEEREEESGTLARITDDEWAMADEALWGPSNTPVASATQSSFILDDKQATETTQGGVEDFADTKPYDSLTQLEVESICDEKQDPCPIQEKSKVLDNEQEAEAPEVQVEGILNNDQGNDASMSKVPVNECDSSTPMSTTGSGASVKETGRPYKRKLNPDVLENEQETKAPDVQVEGILNNGQDNEASMFKVPVNECDSSTLMSTNGSIYAVKDTGMPYKRKLRKIVEKAKRFRE